MEPDSHIGSVIADRYRISRYIGEDALGWRFVGRDQTSRKQVAILRFRPKVIEEQVAQLERSAALAELTHPNVVKVLQQVHTSDTIVRITEWDRGVLLGARLDEDPLLSTSVSWARDLANALVAAHARDLVHTGIAPHTVRLVKRSAPIEAARLDDWGLAALLKGTNPLTSTGLQHRGGAHWMAPESIMKGLYTPATDLYSLGAVLFHCLTGRPPYLGPEMKVLSAHVHEPTPAPSQHVAGVPHWLDQLVITLLAKDPADRFPSAQALRSALDEGAGLLQDSTAHPEHITANVAPTRLPDVAIHGPGATTLSDVFLEELEPVPVPTGNVRALLTFACVALSVLIMILSLWSWIR